MMSRAPLGEISANRMASHGANNVGMNKQSFVRSAVKFFGQSQPAMKRPLPPRSASPLPQAPQSEGNVALAAAQNREARGRSQSPFQSVPSSSRGPSPMGSRAPSPVPMMPSNVTVAGPRSASPVPGMVYMGNCSVVSGRSASPLMRPPSPHFNQHIVANAVPPMARSSSPMTMHAATLNPRSSSPLPQFVAHPYPPQQMPPPQQPRYASPTPGTMLLHGPPPPPSTFRSASPVQYQHQYQQQQHHNPMPWVQTQQAAAAPKAQPVLRNVPLFSDGVRLFAAIPKKPDLALYETLIDDEGTPIKQPQSRLVQWGLDKSGNSLERSQNNRHPSPPPPGASLNRHHAHGFVQQTPAQPQSGSSSLLPCSGLTRASSGSSGSTLPGTRVGSGPCGEIFVSSAEEEDAIVYEATDEGITSFRKVSKSKGIMADASSDRGAVGMHITHSTRTTDEGDVVNVHRVDAIQPGSAAEIAGVLVGDEIVELVGVYAPHLSPPTLRAIFSALPVTGSLRLVVSRPSVPRGSYPPVQSVTLHLFEEGKGAPSSSDARRMVHGASKGSPSSRGDGERKSLGAQHKPIGGASEVVDALSYPEPWHDAPTSALEAAAQVRQAVEKALGVGGAALTASASAASSPATKQTGTESGNVSIGLAGLSYARQVRDSGNDAGRKRAESPYALAARGRSALPIYAKPGRAANRARSDSPWRADSDYFEGPPPHWGQGLPEYVARSSSNSRSRPGEASEAVGSKSPPAKKSPGKSVQWSLPDGGFEKGVSVWGSGGGGGGGYTGSRSQLEEQLDQGEHIIQV